MIEYNLLPDTELFIRLKEGDNVAFSEIYQRFGGILFVFIKRRVGDTDDAKDILQELFVDLWVKRETIEITTKASSYLYAAVRYKMLNFIERNATQKRYVDAIESINEQDMVMTDHLVREKQLASIIERNVDALPKKMKEVFLLSRQVNLTYVEIADKLNISKLTVRAQVKNAIKILRERLNLNL
ncbi:RNA polymerase sigma-70 factor [Pedobacter sp. ok626]|uniref:RNA polymerase sigma-70 factor n=1 Tax=Pedobacter sp. ok626 TaxID=1761882 RepID=UPI0020C908AA|nr:RNA polymerase sigma-70 factor [Pedobacter sp. ok626]